MAQVESLGRPQAVSEPAFVCQQLTGVRDAVEEEAVDVDPAAFEQLLHGLAAQEGVDQDEDLALVVLLAAIVLAQGGSPPAAVQLVVQQGVKKIADSALANR